MKMSDKGKAIRIAQVICTGLEHPGCEPKPHVHSAHVGGLPGRAFEIAVSRCALASDPC